jgi:hypothetical protein
MYLQLLLLHLLVRVLRPVGFLQADLAHLRWQELAAAMFWLQQGALLHLLHYLLFSHLHVRVLLLLLLVGLQLARAAALALAAVALLQGAALVPAAEVSAVAAEGHAVLEHQLLVLAPG